MDNLKINEQRLWDSLMEMAQIGATDKGGVCRLALSDLDRDGRDLFVKWCEAAGCTVRVDQVGNIFARRPGRRPELAPIVTGSHLDSQPTGGKFDGAYGVLAGLEVVRTLNDFEFETDAPLEVVVWTNEEGSRFAPAMMASGVFGGAFDLQDVLAKTDEDGKTFGEELARIGYAGSEVVGSSAVGAYFEAHIEQGPILEAEEKTIGVVTDAQGQRWYEVRVIGQDAHAGPTPMPRRKDALVGAARMVDQVNRIGHQYAPNACATVGMLTVKPNSRNTIPGEVFFTVDFRHPDEATLAQMDAALRQACENIASEASVELEFEQIWHFPATPFDAQCVGAVRDAAQASGFSFRDMVSGAGHDACYVARVAPTAMVFVPCEDGISHNESESATASDLAAGCQTLMHAMIAVAKA
ncbi:MAG: Zn-dependent hydrolase [Gammaproteobacteria bacterium]|nr:Zn-dependent hydrolase [Gammaproteobacteria bacterium]